MRRTSISNHEELAALIKSKRLCCGLTQAELAGASNTGLRFIIDLEKAKPTCQIKKVFDVMQALGIELVELDSHD